MAEKTGMQIDAVDYSGKPITLYSTTGQPHTEAEFAKIIDVYNSSQGQSKLDGFTVLSKGSFQNAARSAFETVNQPIQQAAANLDSPDARINMLPQMLQGPAKWLLKQPAEAVNTPERAMSMAGGIAGGMATGGMSIGPQILAAAAGAGVGNVTSQAAFGTGAQKSSVRVLMDVAQDAAIAGASTGAVGVLKSIFGKTVSQKAQAGTANDLKDYISKQIAPLAHDPNAINILMSTPQGLEKVTRIGITGLRGDADEIAADLTTNLVKGTKSGIAVDQVTPLNNHVKQLVKLQNRLLDNYDADDKVTKPIRDNIDTITKEIDTILLSAIKSNSTAQADKYILQKISTDFHEKVDKLGAAIPLFKALKASGTHNGFDVQRFQMIVRDAASGSGVTDDMALIAGRGKYGGVDTPMRAQLPFGKLLQQVPGAHLIPGIGGLQVGKNYGTRFAGKVVGTAPTATAFANQALASTIKSIKSYQDEAEK